MAAAVDCACGHPKVSHGRCGFGSCAVIYPTDEMTKLAEKWRREYKSEVAVRLIATALHLPGFHAECGCKRFHVRPATTPRGEE